MRWMKLEPIIQSEVSQKDKEHYSILTHKGEGGMFWKNSMYIIYSETDHQPRLDA